MAKIKEQEKRILTTLVECRAIEGEDGSLEYIEGYALKFEKWSDVLWGYFKEIISRNALDNADLSDVVATFNHKTDYPLARTGISGETGNLILDVDNIGLRFKFVPTETTYAQDLKVNIHAGVVNRCSFVFTLDYEDEKCDEWEWNDDEGIYNRRLNNIKKIHDIALVTTPAYSDTEAVIGERSKSKMEELKLARMMPKEKEKLMFELDLLEI